MLTVAPTGTATRSRSSTPARLPPAQNYSVAADFHVKTLLTNDAVAVVGRLQGRPARAPKYYTAGRSTTGAWQIAEGTDTTLTPLATATPQR